MPLRGTTWNKKGGMGRSDPSDLLDISDSSGEGG
jgi:hypothetical protein